MKTFVSRLYALMGCLVFGSMTAVDGQEVQYGTIGFSAEHYAVSEGAASGFATITITRTGGSAGVASVNFYTVDQTASAGPDYMAASGTVLFAAGVTNRTFVVRIMDDVLIEGNETLLLVLTNVTGGATLPGGASSVSAPLVIVDNDFAPGRLSFSSRDYAQDESAGIATISVSRSEGSTGVISVEYRTVDETASEGTDYRGAQGTLVFVEGQTNATFNVEIIDDPLSEGDETVQLVLTNATGGATFSDTLDSASATLTIHDDDFPRGVLSFGSVNYSEDESSGFARITVVRTGGSYGMVSVQYHTMDGSATVGMDYLSANGTLVFKPGQTNSSFVVRIMDDSLVERNETVLLVLTNAAGGATLPGGLACTSATLTIVDSDGPPLTRPRIGNVRRRNAQLEFNLPVEAPNQYTIEYCQSMAAGYWLPLTNFSAEANGTYTVTDSLTNTACFYRIRVER